MRKLATVGGPQAHIPGRRHLSLKLLSANSPDRLIVMVLKGDLDASIASVFLLGASSGSLSCLLVILPTPLPQFPKSVGG